MTDSRFTALATEAFDNLREFEPNALTENTRLAICAAIAGDYEDTGDNQKDYETLRSAIEKVVEAATHSLGDDARDELSGHSEAVSVATIDAFKLALIENTVGTSKPLAR